MRLHAFALTALVSLAAATGNAQEAYRVKDIEPGGSGANIRGLTAVGRRVFFAASDFDHGREPWKTDGTSAGTSLASDIVPGDGSSFPGPFCAAPGLAYFLANDAVHGWEIFRSNGDPAGTSMVADLTPGTNLGSWNLTAVGSTVFFTLEVSGGAEWWRTDGTGAGTIPLTARFSGLYGVAAVNGRLFFSGSQDGVAGGLWKSDGTPSGTVVVKMFGSLGAATDLLDVGGTLFFTVDDGSHGRELWTSDGTDPGTRLVKDIVTGTGSPFFFSFAAVGNRLFFVADDGQSGAELWVSDGTAPGTRLLEIIPGPSSGVPRDIVAYKGEAFFVASDLDGSDALWRSDGTISGTREIVHVAASGSAFIRDLTPVRERLYFVAQHDALGDELWRTDGTAAGTVLAADIWPGSQGSYPFDLVGAGRRLFMVADDGVTGHELWAAPVSAFADVPPLDAFWSFIHALYDAGVTGGCATDPLRYCPMAVVSRETMAVLLLRGKEGPAYTPPACAEPGPFSDVPCSSPYARWIQELAARAVSGGCSVSPPAFCPAAPVDRGQMAVFLLRTKEGPGYVPPGCTAPVFSDVPCSSPYAPWIHEVARRGITAGCGNGNYCPTAPVTRAQMAAFLTVTFGIPLP